MPVSVARLPLHGVGFPRRSRCASFPPPSCRPCSKPFPVKQVALKHCPVMEQEAALASLGIRSVVLVLSRLIRGRTLSALPHTRKSGLFRIWLGMMVASGRCKPAPASLLCSSLLTPALRKTALRRSSSSTRPVSSSLKAKTQGMKPAPRSSLFPSYLPHALNFR